MKADISVVVPVYNVELYLKKCVHSILKQTIKIKEIILVDDGSTDQSSIICDELASSYENIKVVHKKNGGLSSARNSGIIAATGSYLGFVDSDDTVCPEMYEELYRNMIKYDADISICGRYYVSDDGKRFQRFGIDSKTKKLMKSSEEAIYELNSFNSFDMAAWDKLYRIEVFDNIKFPEGKLSEDFFIMYKLFDNCKRVFYTSKPLYNYMQRKNSISHSKQINYDFLEAAENQMKYVESKYTKLKAVVHTAYASAAMTVFDFHVKSNVPIPREERKRLQLIVRSNLKFIFRNNTLRSIKKIQAMLFSHCIYLYKILFKLYKKVDRV